MNHPSDRNMPLPSETKVMRRGTVPQEGDALQDRGTVVATRDHALIRKWAARYRAEPATGEATPSGQATTLDVHDGGARIRLNFPAAAQFRPISWDEWLSVFDRDRLVFVYEPEGTSEGGVFGRQSSSYYRLVPAAEWAGDIH